MINVVMSVLMKIFIVFMKEKVIVNRECVSVVYGVLLYFTLKFVVELLIGVFFLFVFGVCVYLMVGLYLMFGYFV